MDAGIHLGEMVLMVSPEILSYVLHATHLLKQVRVERQHQIAGAQEIDFLKITDVVQHLVFVLVHSQNIDVCDGDRRFQDLLQRCCDQYLEGQMEPRDF